MNRILSKTLVLGFVSILFAQCEGNKSSIPQTSVWKVEYEGNTMYIGGTVHLLRKEDYPIPVGFDSAYNRSEVVVFETDIGEMSTLSSSMKLMELCKFENGQSVETVLSPEVYDQLNKQLDEMKIPSGYFAQYKPSITVTTISVLRMRNLGFIEKGVDSHYFKKAKEDKKAIEFLESLEFQMNLIAEMGKEDYNGFVLKSLNDIDKIDELLPKIVDEWKVGDFTTSKLALQEMKEEYPTFFKELFIDRNNNWMPKLQEYLKSPRVEFVLVGDGHHVGPDGILEKLKSHGATVSHLSE